MAAQLTDLFRFSRSETGRYQTTIPIDWTFWAPSGGVLMSVALAAARVHVDDPTLSLESATTIFCEAFTAGPAEIQCEILRSGKTAAQVQITMQTVRAASDRVSAGPVGLRVLATFAKPRAGYPELTGLTMPNVESPESLPDRDLNPLRFPFFDNFEQRLALGHLPFDDDWTAGPARYCRWLRYRATPARGATLDRLAYPPAIDLMPPALLSALGPEQPPFIAPSLDLTVHFHAETADDWMLLDVRCLRASAGYANCAGELWSKSGTLLAHASQVMLLKEGARSRPAASGPLGK